MLTNLKKKEIKWKAHRWSLSLPSPENEKQEEEADGEKKNSVQHKTE